MRVRSGLLFSCLVAGGAMPARGQGGVPDTATARKPLPRLDTLVATGRVSDLVGVAASPNQGTVGAADLALRPLLRPGEVVENIPGVIVTQHSGSGKANQYFLRGFNLDHGTDLAISVDGVPVNMTSHAHGQGYADLNFLIPELVQRVDFKKGPYYADVGEFEHNDGPWTQGDNERKYGGLLRYARGTEHAGFTLTALGYHNDWRSTDQIPDRAVAAGLIGRFGSIDPADAGRSGRLRYFGPRPLTQDGGVTSPATSLVYTDVGYNLSDTWNIGVSVFNVFNSRVSEIDYFYTSRLHGEPLSGVNDVHTHAADPRSVRVSITARLGSAGMQQH